MGKKGLSYVMILALCLSFFRSGCFPAPLKAEEVAINLEENSADLEEYVLEGDSLEGVSLDLEDEYIGLGEDNQADAEVTGETVRAKVIRIISEDRTTTNYSGGTLSFDYQVVEVKVLEGKYKGEVYEVEYQLNFGTTDTKTSAVLEPGDKVFLYIESSNGEIENIYISELVRDTYLLYLTVGFILILMIIGGLKGLKAVISLAFTCLAVVKILLPLILKGYNPVLVAILVCTCIATLTLVLVSGFNKKTLSAIIGTTGGVIAAGLIAFIIGSLAKLTGLGDEESIMLLYIPQEVNFDFRGLLFAGIIIGALGAAIDTAISIASAMSEIKTANPKMTRGELIKSGMNVGKDMMATMSNTLILAYAGGSLQLMLLFMAYEIPFAEIINRDIIASEVVRSIAGSIGLIFTIPITAFVSAFLAERGKKRLIKSSDEKASDEKALDRKELDGKALNEKALYGNAFEK